MCGFLSQLGTCNAPAAAVGWGHKMNSKSFIFSLLLFKKEST